MLKGESEESLLNSKGWYTPGDKLQQHVAMTRCSDKSLRGRGEFLWKSLSLQHNFVASTSRTNLVWFDFLRLVAETRFCCGDKDFHKNSPVHTKWFVAATWRRNVLLQEVAGPVHMELSGHPDLLLQLVAWCLPTLRQGRLREPDFINTNLCARVNKHHFGGKTR